MTDIATSANIIQVEETDFRSPDSENLKSRMGASINYALKRNSTLLSLNGEGFHRISSINDLQPHHYIRKNSNINTYVLTNNLNGSGSTDLAINAKVYDESGTLLGDLCSVSPSINTAIAGVGVKGRYSIGRELEDSNDINSGANKGVGSLNFTSLNEGYFLTFFVESAQDDGAGFNFQLWLRETS